MSECICSVHNRPRPLALFASFLCFACDCIPLLSSLHVVSPHSGLFFTKLYLLYQISCFISFQSIFFFYLYCYSLLQHCISFLLASSLFLCFSAPLPCYCVSSLHLLPLSLPSLSLAPLFPPPLSLSLPFSSRSDS